MNPIDTAVELAKIFVPVSIFFVWVVRYDNIIREFKQYKLPDWTRDLVGILKMSFAVMILSSNGPVLKIGAAGIATLMVAALLMHLKVKNPLHKMLPAFTLMTLSLFILFSK
jgi:hypothetical protein